MCASFPFGFEGRIRDLIGLIPDHCLSFYLASNFISVVKNITTNALQLL